MQEKQEHFIHSPQRIQKRLNVYKAIMNGMSNSEIRETYHVGNSIISEIRKKIAEGREEEFLYSAHKAGRPTKQTDDVCTVVRNITRSNRRMSCKKQ